MADGTISQVARVREALHMAQFDRITVDPAQMGGVPCIRRLRIPVATIVGLAAEGKSELEILTGYPDLELAGSHS